MQGLAAFAIGFGPLELVRLLSGRVWHWPAIAPLSLALGLLQPMPPKPA